MNYRGMIFLYALSFVTHLDFTQNVNNLLSQAENNNNDNNDGNTNTNNNNNNNNLHKGLWTI